MAPTLADRDGIAVLTFGDDDNRFSPEWLEALGSLLDGVEADARGLVTVGTGKFYSNGLDLQWLLAHGDRAGWYVDEVHALFARMLTFGLPTVAAVNGHAFGAAAMLALAHDYRIMRADRGYYCFPEADIDIPFTPGMSALIQRKLTPQTAVRAMTTGHRYGGEEAARAGLVDATATQDALVDEAVALLAPIVGKKRDTIRAIKTTMYADVVAVLAQPH